jgi:hypothetical protein
MISIGYKSLIINKNFERTTNCKQRQKELNVFNSLVVEEQKNSENYYYKKNSMISIG